MFFAERLVNMPTRARRFTSQASVGMFASRIPSSQLSKNDSFSTVKKRPVLHYTCAGRAICASFDPLGVYIYAVGVESCATRLTLLRSVPLRPEPWPRMAPLVEFGAVLGVSASLPLPAPPLPSSSRRYAPQCFVGGIPSGPLRPLRGSRFALRQPDRFAAGAFLALRRVSLRIQRTASSHVAQFGTRPLVPCLTFHKARLFS